MHAGIVHILLNVLVLMLAGGQLEKELGWFCFLIIFFAGGIFGYVSSPRRPSRACIGWPIT